MFLRLILLFLSLLLPLFIVIGQPVVELFLSVKEREWMMHENGPYEFLQFFTLTAAALVALYTLMTMNRKTDPLVTFWVILAFVCCTYVSGEEISWGQHLFFWQTPETWSILNDQNETNLHNVSSWFDQKPRLILEIAVIIGGILLPIYRRFYPDRLPKRYDMIYPTNDVIPLAVMSTFAKQSQSMADWINAGHLYHRVSEVQELLFFLFVLVYLIVLKTRIQSRDHS